ncbi:MAG: restriction endonuclease subunit S [Saprospiraceae bacterium]|nr:restriction endonuclease subunit S [Saprospiraceae bacterium]
MGEWKEIKLGEIADLIMGQSPDGKYYNSEGNGMPFLQGCSEFGKHHPETTVFSTVIKKLAPENSILFSVRAPVGKTNLANKKYCIGRGIAAIKGKDVDNSFLNHAIYFRSINGGFISQGSTFDSINHSELSKLEILLPLEKIEQTTIANILTTIDQAIEKTEQLIAKYERIKTGLMQDLLTCGIDEQGNIRSEETHEFKDSVLGRIPVEWEVITLKNVCEKIQDGTHFSPEISEVGEFMYITSKNIRMGELDLKNVDFITRDAHESIYRRCSVGFGDVLLTKDGANTGNVCINTIKEPISLLSSVAFLRGKKDYLRNDFLFQTLACEKLQKTFKDQMSGNAITRTTLTKIKATQVAIPKIIEQERIISILEKFDSNLSKEKGNLLMYKSTKTALMQDLLTGKVRVDALITHSK